MGHQLLQHQRRWWQAHDVRPLAVKEQNIDRHTLMLTLHGKEAREAARTSRSAQGNWLSKAAARTGESAQASNSPSLPSSLPSFLSLSTSPPPMGPRSLLIVRRVLPLARPPQQACILQA